jgi:hypothetical protein
MAGSKPVANDKVLFKDSSVCSRSVADVDYVQKGETCAGIRKSMAKIWVKLFLHC